MSFFSVYCVFGIFWMQLVLVMLWNRRRLKHHALRIQRRYENESAASYVTRRSPLRDVAYPPGVLARVQRPLRRLLDGAIAPIVSIGGMKQPAQPAPAMKLLPDGDANQQRTSFGGASAGQRNEIAAGPQAPDPNLPPDRDRPNRLAGWMGLMLKPGPTTAPPDAGDENVAARRFREAHERFVQRYGPELGQEANQDDAAAAPAADDLA